MTLYNPIPQLYVSLQLQKGESTAFSSDTLQRYGCQLPELPFGMAENGDLVLTTAVISDIAAPEECDCCSHCSHK